MRKWLMSGLMVLTVVSCLSILGCGKKGHCSECKNDSDCDSDNCATFVTNSGNKFLACSNGSSNDTCTAPQ